MEKTPIYNIRPIYIQIFFLSFLLTWSVNFAGPWSTDALAQGASPEKNIEDLHATSDKVIFDSTERYAEMIGNVKVTQGQTIITAGALRIYYREGNQQRSNELPGNESIEKIVATNNVRIELDSGIAISNEAVYHADRKTIVLSGQAKLIRGENSISGSKITINRENGRVTVESSDKEPVEALIFSNEKL